MKWALLLLIMVAFGGAGCARPVVRAQAADRIVPNKTSGQVPPSVSKLEAKIEATGEPDPDGATLVGVGFAAGGSYIAVAYKAPYALALNWQQGDVYVVDESSGTVYEDVVKLDGPVGPFFQRPMNADQIASVMLWNRNLGIKSGSMVTVVLGKYKRLHTKMP